MVAGGCGGGEFSGDASTNFLGLISRPERLVFSSSAAEVVGVAGVVIVVAGVALTLSVTAGSASGVSFTLT